MITKILGASTLIMGLGLAFLFRANAALNEDLGAARVSIEQAAAANQSNVAAIQAIRDSLSTCVSDRTVDKEQNRLVVDQLNRDMEDLRAERQRVRVVREEIFREPSCRELGEIDIGVACPALRDELYERANRLDQN